MGMLKKQNKDITICKNVHLASAGSFLCLQNSSIKAESQREEKSLLQPYKGLGLCKRFKWKKEITAKYCVLYLERPQLQRISLFIV